MKDEIRKYALQNALLFKGKANPKAIVGKIMGSIPQARDDPKATMTAINQVVDEVNKLPLEKQREELKTIAPEMLEKKVVEKKEGLKDLPSVEGKVCMRMEPSPSGPLHIGHSYVLSLNYGYVQKYGGRFYLRIADTNPDNIDTHAYRMIPIDAKWLCEGSIDDKDILVQSDRLDIYHKRAKELIEKGSAYICECDPEPYRELLSKSEACPCRELSTAEQLKRYDKMFDGYDAGDAVMRFKSDLTHKNPAMRDFPLMRINETPHPRQGMKYRVWPLMNLAVSVDDMETKITHTLRAKDHADNAKRQAMLHDVWGYKTPVAISVGRINFDGFELSTSKTRAKIEAGEYNGWDDIRLPFLPALRRRGYQPAALQKFAQSMGVTKTDKTVKIEDFFKSINAFNKDILEPVSKRFFFIPDPVKITVEGAKVQDIELDLHPDNIKGGRPLAVEDKFLIAQDDYDRMSPGKITRLMDCLNLIHEQESISFHSLDYETYKKEGCCHIIHWLPDDSEQTVDCEVNMPDGKIITGVAEQNIKQLDIGDVIQFERFGFCRFDSADDGKYVFWFTHK